MFRQYGYHLSYFNCFHIHCLYLSVSLCSGSMDTTSLISTVFIFIACFCLFLYVPAVWIPPLLFQLFFYIHCLFLSVSLCSGSMDTASLISTVFIFIACFCLFLYVPAVWIPPLLFQLFSYSLLVFVCFFMFRQYGYRLSYFNCFHIHCLFLSVSLCSGSMDTASLISTVFIFIACFCLFLYSDCHVCTLTWAGIPPTLVLPGQYYSTR